MYYGGSRKVMPDICGIEPSASQPEGCWFETELAPLSYPKFICKVEGKYGDTNNLLICVQSYAHLAHVDITAQVLSLQRKHVLSSRTYIG